MAQRKKKETSPPPAYFKSLTIRDYKCFKGEVEIDLTDGNGKPAQWTVILGNNNTGKTTMLDCFAALKPVPFGPSSHSDEGVGPSGRILQICINNTEVFGTYKVTLAIYFLTLVWQIKRDFGK